MRTITLSGRPPVTINDEKWTLIASASDKEWDNQYEFQANRISKWFVGARQHEDGRAIVYATYSYSTQWQSERDHYAKAGVLLEINSTNEQIISAIQDVCSEIAGKTHNGEDAERWNSLCDEIIADMPAEILD